MNLSKSVKLSVLKFLYSDEPRPSINECPRAQKAGGGTHMKKERKDPVINDPWPAWPQQSSNRLQANIYRIKPLCRQLLSLGSMRNLWLSIYLLASLNYFFFLQPKNCPCFHLKSFFLSSTLFFILPIYKDKKYKSAKVWKRT